MTLPLPPGGQQIPPEPTAQPSQPQAPAGAPVPALPQQTAQQKPAYSFNTVEEAVAFANAQVELKRTANSQAKETREELTALKQQLDFLVVQQRLAQQQALAANVQLAAKTAGFRDPDFIYSAIASGLQYDAAGQPVNLQAVLDALKTSKPYLLEVPNKRPNASATRT